MNPHSVLPEPDFESDASADSAILARVENYQKLPKEFPYGIVVTLILTD